MRFEKLFYSKCPHCGERGLPAIKFILPNRLWTNTCKHCKHRFYANPGWATLATFAHIGVMVYLLLGPLAKLTAGLPEWLGTLTDVVVLAAMLPVWYVFQYFMPLQEEVE